MFPEGERKTFAYFDGTKQVHADPLALHRALVLAFGGDLQGVLDASREPEEQPREEGGAPVPESLKKVRWAEGQGALVAGVRRAFGMADFDPATGAGATEADCLSALWAYFDYLESKKKPSANLPTASPPTGEASSAAVP